MTSIFWLLAKIRFPKACVLKGSPRITNLFSTKHHSMICIHDHRLPQIPHHIFPTVSNLVLTIKERETRRPRWELKYLVDFKIHVLYVMLWHVVKNGCDWERRQFIPIFYKLLSSFSVHLRCFSFLFTIQAKLSVSISAFSLNTSLIYYSFLISVPPLNNLHFFFLH